MLKQDKQQFVENARKVYEERLKEQLEKEHFGQVIGLEPESGEYVLGHSFMQVGQASYERFGTRPVYYFRVGGGGAVKIGGPVRRARLSG